VYVCVRVRVRALPLRIGRSLCEGRGQERDLAVSVRGGPSRDKSTPGREPRDGVEKEKDRDPGTDKEGYAWEQSILRGGDGERGGWKREGLTCIARARGEGRGARANSFGFRFYIISYGNGYGALVGVAGARPVARCSRRGPFHCGTAAANGRAGAAACSRHQPVGGKFSLSPPHPPTLPLPPASLACCLSCLLPLLLAASLARSLLWLDFLGWGGGAEEPGQCGLAHRARAQSHTHTLTVGSHGFASNNTSFHEARLSVERATRTPALDEPRREQDPQQPVQGARLVDSWQTEKLHTPLVTCKTLDLARFRYCSDPGHSGAADAMDGSILHCTSGDRSLTAPAARGCAGWLQQPCGCAGWLQQPCGCAGSFVLFPLFFYYPFPHLPLTLSPHHAHHAPEHSHTCFFTPESAPKRIGLLGGLSETAI